MVIKNLLKAWKALKGNIPYLIIAVILECIFVIALSALQMYYFLPTANAALEAGGIMEQQLAEIEQIDAYRLEGMLIENDAFMEAYHVLLANLAMFLLMAFIVFVIFRSILWYLSLKSIHKKMPLKTVLFKFSLIAGFWAIVLLAIMIVYNLITSGAASLLPLIGSGTATVIALILTIISIYFAITGFALIPARQSFKKMFSVGWKHAGKIIPAYLINLAVLAVTIILPFTFFQQYTFLALLFMILITAPSAAFTRLHAIAAVWETKQK